MTQHILHKFTLKMYNTGKKTRQTGQNLTLSQDCNFFFTPV